VSERVSEQLLDSTSAHRERFDVEQASAAAAIRRGFRRRLEGTFKVVGGVA